MRLLDKSVNAEKPGYATYATASQYSISTLRKQPEANPPIIEPNKFSNLMAFPGENMTYFDKY